MRSFRSVLSIVFSMGLITAPLTATAQVKMSNPGEKIQSSQNSFAQFTPNPQSSTRINYDTWSDLLEVMVLSTGQSTRISAPKPTPITGSRLVIGHKSAFRLEGNKIAFSKFKPDFLSLISDYRIELDEIGNTIDIASLSRNEQLAYWMNLHNVVVIEQIAIAYPVITPTSLNVGSDKQNLYDAKIVNIKGTALSLRDIRENIVFKNWSDPVVIYGFFLGDLGSPSIQNYAFDADNVQTAIDIIAYEFTNSLRGFSRGRVSKIYGDVAPFFFPNFQKDLTNHLSKYMRDDVADELSRYSDLKVTSYAYTVADIVGGYGNRTQGLPVQRRSREGSLYGDLKNDAFSAYISELTKKFRKLNDMGLTKRGTVIIEDIETIVNENELVDDN